MAKRQLHEGFSPNRANAAPVGNTAILVHFSYFVFYSNVSTDGIELSDGVDDDGAPGAQHAALQLAALRAV
jgi:hypothetical protein